MSTIKHLRTTNAEETESIAHKIGAQLRGGEVIELVSDLGGGKTTFTRGLARGAGSQDAVASPTFTINRIYRAPHFDINHFDFYRLDDPGVMADELAELIDDPQIVTVVEWADSVQHVLPDQRLKVTIKQTPEGDRDLTISGSRDIAYLLEGF